MKLKNKMKKKYIVYILLIIILASIFMFTRRGDKTEANNLDNQIKTVSVINIGTELSGAVLATTGSVNSKQEADLKAQSSGQITSVKVNVGDIVSKGQVLATLSNQDVVAQLAQAEAVVQIQKAQLAELERKTSGNTFFNNIEQQQQSIVDGAYSKLLSEGLVAEPRSDGYTLSFDDPTALTPPTISGRYSGPEGTYKIRVDRGSQINDYEIDVFDLEKVTNVEISETAQTPMGTRGLYISFSNSTRDYIDTTWYVNLPNTQSSSYLQNYNSYLSAQKNAEVSLQQSTVSEEQLNSQKAQVSQAEANLAVVQAQLAKTIIRAPFSGDIVSVSVSDGEYISVGQSAISLINKTGLFIQSFVGVDESKIIKVENEAIINKKFLATVTNIASGVNTTNGKVEIAITPNSTDDLLIIGEFVDVEIYTNRDSLSEAILIPLQAIKPRSDGSFVYVVNTEGILEETKVETGDIVGESIEIISGLPLSTTIANPVRGLRDGMKVKVKN